MLLQSISFVHLIDLSQLSNNPFYIKNQQDEEPVDRLPQLREECKPSCTTSMSKYEACVKRVKAAGEGDCEAWFFDHLHCLDKCVAPKVFKYTK